MNTFLLILLGITCGIIASSVGFVFGESIEDQLNNARETNKLIDEKQAQAGLNSSTLYELIRQYGYNENRGGAIISTDDILTFLNDYNSGNLVNKTVSVTQSQEAKDARALFDKYW